MIAYLDASVLLRKLLDQPSPHRAWGTWKGAITSALTETEVPRSIDRFRLAGRLTDPEVARHLEMFKRLRSGLDVIALDATVLQRAARPFPTTLGTLDALHLASAILWSERNPGPLHFLTHDQELETAARAVGFET